MSLVWTENCTDSGHLISNCVHENRDVTHADTDGDTEAAMGLVWGVQTNHRRNEAKFTGSKRGWRGGREGLCASGQTQDSRAAREAELIPAGQAEGGSPRQQGSWPGLAVVRGRFSEDTNWVTEPSFPGRALLHLFGFPQSKHYLLDIFNSRSSSHTPVFAYLLLHKKTLFPQAPSVGG